MPTYREVFDNPTDMASTYDDLCKLSYYRGECVKSVSSVDNPQNDIDCRTLLIETYEPESTRPPPLSTVAFK